MAKPSRERQNVETASILFGTTFAVDKPEQLLIKKISKKLKPILILISKSMFLYEYGS
jgi:hypothetical protein